MDLIEAAKSGNAEECKRLLDLGSDAADYDWAFQCAAFNGHLEVCKLLLSAGASIYAKNNYANWQQKMGTLKYVSCC